MTANVSSLLPSLYTRISQNIKNELDDIKNKIESNYANISKNKENIERNTGAVALLHTLNSNSNKYFIIWIITFMAFLFSIGYIVYLKTEYTKVETLEEVEQTNANGDNNFIGRDGDIIGDTKDKN